jgi:hypothetical protein
VERHRARWADVDHAGAHSQQCPDLPPAEPRWAVAGL